MGQQQSTERLSSSISCPSESTPNVDRMSVNSDCRSCNRLVSRRPSLDLTEEAGSSSFNCLGADCFSRGDSVDEEEAAKRKKGKQCKRQTVKMENEQCESDINVNSDALETLSAVVASNYLDSAEAELVASSSNGNTIEDPNENIKSMIKSSSIHRYMSVFSDRPDKGDGASDKSQSKNKKSAQSKTTSKVTPEAGTSNGNKQSTKSKKKQWVPKFCSSKLKTTKVNVNRSNESGLDVVSSSGDGSCVCTMYRKMDSSKTEDRVNFTHSSECTANSQNAEANKPDPRVHLPFNITVARVALGNNEGVYGTIQNAARQAGSAGLYGPLQGARSTVYGALFTRECDGRSGTGTREGNVVLLSVRQTTHVIDLSRLSNNDAHLEDCDERARVLRAQEIADGVDPPPGYRPPHIQVVSPGELTALLFHQEQLAIQQSVAAQTRIHTQVDYIHCLIPDLQAITGCSFYWGKMDRYEAERLLEGKPEGTFLLRDSAHEDHLFSVSFRKYDRSLHARIEQFNHKFSFDARDPGVYASNTVTGLIEHYKDDACLMFFEPMLTRPLPRTFTFSLQHLCRSVIASNITYDGINQLKLPNSLKAYLKEYHYRQRVRVKRFEDLYEWEPPEGLRWEPPEGIRWEPSESQ